VIYKLSRATHNIFKGHLQLYSKGPLREGAWNSNPAQAGSPSINNKTVGQRQMRRSPNERRRRGEACGTAEDIQEGYTTTAPSYDIPHACGNQDSEIHDYSPHRPAGIEG